MTEFDFSPIERMTAHLRSHDQAEARKRVARERRPRPRTADSDTPKYCAAATALGDRTAADWVSDREWDVRYAPYFVASFFDWRIEMAEQFRQSFANDKMLNHHLRKVWDCNTDSAASIWQEFDGLIETLRARIIAGVESRSITRLDIKGMAHVDTSTTIDYMRGIGSCALLEIATGVANAGSEAKPNDHACALPEVATGVANDVGEVKPNDLAAGWKVHATRFADEVRNAKSHRPLTKKEVGKKVHAKMVEAFEKGESSMAKRGGRGVPDLNTVVRNIKAFAAVKNS